MLGRFLARLNRFLGTVEIPGSPETCGGDSVIAKVHIKDSGRLEEVLLPGNLVAVRAEPRVRARETDWDLVLVRCGTEWVSVDPSLTLKLMEQALACGGLPEFRGYSVVKREARCGGSRLDFLLMGSGVAPALVEVKSVTLVREGVALFPDAPTVRGTRHLRELIRARSEGYEASLVFVVQRRDALCVKPNRETDETFARALAEAEEAGVRVLAFRCCSSLREVSLERTPVPVVLGDG